MKATKIIREQKEEDSKRYHDENSSFPKEWYFDKFNKILEVVLDDVPHQYQDRLLDILVDKS